MYGCGCGVVECVKCGGLGVRWWSVWTWVWGGGVWGRGCEVVEYVDVSVEWWSV